MARRLQDTEECKTHFVRGLPGPYRAFWFWLKQSACDHAGIWEIDIDEARMRTGFYDIELDVAEKLFSSKVLKLNCNEKWFLMPFLMEQHGTENLNPTNTYHWGAIVILQKLGLMTNDFIVLKEQLNTPIKPLFSSSKAAKESVRLSVKLIESVKSETIVLPSEEIKIDPPVNPKKEKAISAGKTDFSYFWDAYDKKKGEKEKIQKKWDALSITDQDLIFKHIDLYKLEQPNKWYRKDPDTYLNNKSWLDEILTPPVVSISTKATTSKTENIINIATAAQYQEPA